MNKRNHLFVNLVFMLSKKSPNPVFIISEIKKWIKLLHLPLN